MVVWYSVLYTLSSVPHTNCLPHFFWGGGAFCRGQVFFCNWSDDILHIQRLMYWDILDLIIVCYFNIRNK